MNAIIHFPHQLFRQPMPEVEGDIYLVEEPLFFLQFNFHPLKRAYHRATMKVYESELKDSGKSVHYIDAHHKLAETSKLIEHLAGKGVSEVHLYDVVDDWLERRLTNAMQANGIAIKWHHSPQFMESKKEVLDYSGGKKRLFHADFYKKQRLKHRVLIDTSGNPIGGQWSFDEEIANVIRLLQNPRIYLLWMRQLFGMKRCIM